MIEQALEMANKAHSGQKRKSTDIAYIIHPMEAGAIASSILTQLGRYDEDVISAAILHDTIEDTEIVEEDLLTKFNKRITFLVTAQSEDKTKSWKERKQHTIDYLSKTEDTDVKIVHLADKLSNMRSIARDYKMIGDKLWDRFNESRITEQGWYYSSLADSLDDLKGTNEHKEFKTLIREVFN